MSAPIADWVVEISVPDADAVKQVLAEQKAKLEEAERAAQKYGVTVREAQSAVAEANKKTERVIAEAAKAQETATREAKIRAEAEARKQHQVQSQMNAVVAASYVYLADKVMGYVRAALSASVEGQRLAFWFEQLNLQIGSIFKPAIDAVTTAVEKLTQWFQQLSGGQQALLRNLTAGTLAFLLMAKTAPMLIGAFQSLQTAFGFLAANPFLAAIAGMTALIVSTEEGRAAFLKMFQALAPVGDALKKVFAAFAPAIESLSVAYAKVAEALAPVFETVGQIIATVAEAVSPIIEALMPLVQTVGIVVGAVAFLIGLLKPLLELIHTVFSALKPIFEGIAAVIKLLLLPLTLLSRLFGSARQERQEPQRREQLTQRVGGLESLEATYSRIQQAVAQSSSIPAQTLDETRRIRVAVERREPERAVVR